MKKLISFLFPAAALCAALATFTSCSSSSSTPASSQNNPTFAFNTGNTFQYTLTILDTDNNVVPSEQKTIHESIVASGVTYAGVSGAYMALDSAWNADGSYYGMDMSYMRLTERG